MATIGKVEKTLKVPVKLDEDDTHELTDTATTALVLAWMGYSGKYNTDYWEIIDVEHINYDHKVVTLRYKGVRK